MSTQPDTADEVHSVEFDLAQEPHQLGCAMATALSMPTAIACSDFSADQRLVFWTGLAAALSGMMEASIGYQRTHDVLEVIQRLKSAEAGVVRH